MTPIGPIDTFSLPIRQIRQVSPFWEAAHKTDWEAEHRIANRIAKQYPDLI